MSLEMRDSVGNNTLVKRLEVEMEAMHLLVHVGCNESYQDSIQKYEKVIPDISEEFRKKVQILTNVEKELKKALENKSDDMKYYFGRTPGEGLNVAQILFFWNTYYCSAKKRTFEEWILEIQNYSQEEYCKSFSKHLAAYNSVMLDEISDDELCEEPLCVIKQIMDMSLSDEEKWKLQNVFLYPEKHRQNVLALLQIAVGVIKAFDTEIQYVVELFTEYWKKKLSTIHILDYLRDELNIHLDKNPHGEMIFASVFLPTTINIMADGKDGVINSEYFIRIGVLFDDTFDVSKEMHCQEYKEEAIKNLKLLSDKSKFEILSYLKDKKAYGSELAKQLNLTTATISHHMSALMKAGLVHVEKEETKIYYRANRENIEKFLKYCESTLL